MTTIAIVGTGPTGVYAFKALATVRSPETVTIWLFEKGADAGVGMPYSDDTASAVMLANIASIEIPPVTRSYLDWLGAQTGALLRSYGIDPDDLDERDFTPRLMLGRYYRDEFDALVHSAEALGHRVELRERTEVTDIRPGPDGRLWLSTDQGEIEQASLARGGEGRQTRDEVTFARGVDVQQAARALANQIAAIRQQDQSPGMI